ncbi:MAG: hypothetical protein OEW00_05510 [candidate division Zixibacteria bacterium]|nr:hypothetical protein [candidate division Zixibacteria bacterium]
MDSLASLFAAVLSHGLHVTLMLISFFIFLHLVEVLQDARFLRNMAYTWLLMTISYLTRIVMEPLLHFLQNADNYQDLANAALIIRTCVSFASTYFLVRAWHLIRVYPETALTRAWTAKTLGLLTFFVGLAAAAAQSPVVMSIMLYADDLTSAFAAILVAVAFWKFDPKTEVGVRPTVRHVIRIGTTTAFALWGLTNLFRLATEKGWLLANLIPADDLPDVRLTVFVLLMLFKLVAALMAAVMALCYLKEKPEYRAHLRPAEV